MKITTKLIYHHNSYMSEFEHISYTRGSNEWDLGWLFKTYLELPRNGKCDLLNLEPFEKDYSATENLTMYYTM